MDTERSYVRFVAVGDSVTYGLGDRAAERSRGWARLLGMAIAGDHHVSFCNLAQPGATAAQMRAEQLDEALDHRPTGQWTATNETKRASRSTSSTSLREVLILDLPTAARGRVRG
jgi:hypothetical protein